MAIKKIGKKGYQIGNGNSHTAYVPLGNNAISTTSTNTLVTYSDNTISFAGEYDKIVDYVNFLSEVLKMEYENLPDVNQYHDMSEEDRKILIRDFKINKIIE